MSKPLPSIPLAERMRPSRIEEYYGQEALLSEGSPLRRAIETDHINSFILWGPPGTGKTTLARLVSKHTDRKFIALSAVMSGVKDIKDSVAQAQYFRDVLGKKTIMFVDEIHRFNKSQQDALLPFVEDGTVTLIGATTENPSFELNSALLSRAPVLVLKSLSPLDLKAILEKALSDVERGLGSYELNLPEAWIIEIAQSANGDARRALNLLEQVGNYLISIEQTQTIDPDSEASKSILQKALGKKLIRYDSSGEEHYDTISAFIKSMRDSDPDASLYYLARMLEAGEDPLFIARRMVIFASEDIGNADPRALQLAVSVRDAVDFVGMPEARICLAQGVTFLASAAKSNASYVGITRAMSDVQEHGNLEIPLHIKNAPTKLMKTLGYGKKYQYAHDTEKGFSEMINLPQKIQNAVYYEPKDSGLETQIKEKTNRLRSARKQTQKK